MQCLYTKGWGVPSDKAEAARWYRRAASQGVVEAQYNLGAMYILKCCSNNAMEPLRAAYNQADKGSGAR